MENKGEGAHLEDIDIDGRIILKLGVKWSGGHEVGLCVVCGNSVYEPLGSIKYKNFLDLMRNC